MYDELVARACAPPFEARAKSLRLAFERHTGAFADDHPGRAARDAAGWEDALVRGGLATEIAETLDDPAEQSLAQIMARAQRGVFEVVSGERLPYVRDRWGGAAFLLLARDDVGRAAAAARGADASVFVGRVVAGVDGCAVLPGLVWLPSESLPLIDGLADRADARGMGVDDFADALLRMDHALATMSRVKAAHAFRLEAVALAGEPRSGR